MINKDFFESSLEERDKDIFNSIKKEHQREQIGLELIASENIVSKAVLEAQGSILTNKYAEGYPAKRYYCGCAYVDEVEVLAIERAKHLFQCQYANVQPHSGSQANQAVFLALLQPGDTVLGMSLEAGGHLTHGSSVNMSGKWFKAVSYGVCRDTHLIDYEEVETLAQKHRPKMIIAGASAYPRRLDFERFRAIADKVGAFLMVDMAHIAGLVAASLHPSPLPFAHVVTSTTHKTLRGPRGGLILTQDEALAKKINSAIFPGLQGGPLMHVIAAKAVAFKEALHSSFKTYIQRVIKNAKVLGETLIQEGFSLVSDGTDNHLLLVDLRPQQLKGNQACYYLEEGWISCNKNTIPFDTEKPFITSGLRFGTPACTTRGFGEEEFRKVGQLIALLLHNLKEQKKNEADILHQVRQAIEALCARFPIYT